MGRMVIVGLKRPYVAATLGGAWVIGRILYTLGYATGEPAKRMSRGGILQMIATLGQYLSSIVIFSFALCGLKGDMLNFYCSVVFRDVFYVRIHGLRICD